MRKILLGTLLAMSVAGLSACSHKTDPANGSGDDTNATDTATNGTGDSASSDANASGTATDTSGSPADNAINDAAGNGSIDGNAAAGNTL